MLHRCLSSCKGHIPITEAFFSNLMDCKKKKRKDNRIKDIFPHFGFRTVHKLCNRKYNTILFIYNFRYLAVTNSSVKLSQLAT